MKGVSARSMRWVGPGPVLAGVFSLVAGCTPPAFVPAPFDPIPTPAAEDVAAVVFLVGDAGAVTARRSPLAHRLREDVEAWSARLPADSSVAVLYLGDNVYPVGIRDRTHPDFRVDSARLHAQVWSVGGPQARRRGTTAHFVPGNHDWGNLKGPEGLARLRNQQRLLARFARLGMAVRLTPSAGEPGPAVVDIGDAVRLLILDTHWWLQSQNADRKEEVVARLTRLLEEAGDRAVFVAAHHPFATAGPHGGLGGVDAFWLLRRTGSIVQDLNATPFRELRAGLSRAFGESRPPLAFVAGHDHSLQVLETEGPRAPRWTLVSGAASKLSPVGADDRVTWAGTRPGYMKVMVRRDGRVDLFVEGVEARFLRCSGVDPEPCVARGAAAFTTLYSVRLR